MKIRQMFRPRRPSRPALQTRASWTVPQGFGTQPAWAGQTGDRVLVPTWYSPTEALKLPAVQAGVKLLTTELARMPINVEELRGAEYEQVDAMDGDQLSLNGLWGFGMTKSRGMTLAMRSLLLHGYAAIWVNRLGDNVLELVPLNPQYVTRESVGAGIVYRWHAGGSIPAVLPREDLVWLDWAPPADGFTSQGGPFTQCWEAIRAALGALLWSASYYGRGATPDVVWTVAPPAPGVVPGALPDNDDLWRAEDEMRHDGRTSMLAPVGVEPKVVGSNAKSAQLVELQVFGVQQVARCLGIPAPVLQDLSHGTFANYGQSLRYLARFTITSLARQWSEELSVTLYPDMLRRIVLDVGDIGDESISEKWARLNAAVQARTLTINEAREEFGLPPSDDPIADLLGLPAPGDAATEDEEVEDAVPAQ